MTDIPVLADKNLAAPATQTSTTASRRGSVSAQVDILDQRFNKVVINTFLGTSDGGR